MKEAGGLVAVVPAAPARWICETIDTLANLGGRPVDVLVGDGDEDMIKGGDARAGPLGRLYRRLDTRRYAETTGPLAPGRFPDRADIRVIGKPPERCTLALSFTGRAAAHDLAPRARGGCLYPQFAEPANRWLGFHELFAGEPCLVSGIHHVVASRRGALDTVLDHHRSRAHLLSLRRTREIHASKLPLTLVRVVQRALEDLVERPPSHGPLEGLEAGTRDRRGRRGHPVAPRSDQPPRPTESSILRLIPRVLSRSATASVARRWTHRQWLVSWTRSDEALDRVSRGEAPPDLEVFEPPDDRFWADPFPVRTEGGHLVFVEEYLYETGRARIACIEVDTGRRVPEVMPVLEEPHHLSYPYVFSWRGDWYMLPEASESRALLLYRARDFPGGWEPVQPLLEERGVADATLFEADDGWWMFAVLQGQRSESWDEDLHLYHADTPLGPWRPHPKNPLRNDPSGARPAGKLFRRNGRLFRPGQDCAGSYGRAIILHEVLELSTSSYRERPVARLDPEWMPGLVGTHTLNACPGLVVLDGVRRRLGRP